MASIRKRAPRTPGGSTTYQVRYRDPAGADRSHTFSTSSEAKRFRSEIQADLQRGSYVDHSLGRMTLGEYASLWLAVQVYGESTREANESRVRLHVLPILGATPLAALRTSQVQAWVRAKQKELAPRTVRGLVSLLSAILNDAVADDRIAKNPCGARAVRLPKLDERKVVPWTEQQVLAMRRSLPERYRIMLAITAGLGLRQGEVFGLAVDDVDFMRGFVRVQRQVSIVGSRLVFALPKGRKVRVVPLPDSVRDLLNAHFRAFPSRTVVLPWEVPTGKLVEARLFLSSREGGALNRNYINRSVGKPALATAGIPTTRENGMHSGRHFYASVQLEGGTSIRALADYLGHSDPGFTLRTYTHLMPQSQDKAKRAVDDAFEKLETAADDPRCGPNVAQGAS